MAGYVGRACARRGKLAKPRRDVTQRHEMYYKQQFFATQLTRIIRWHCTVYRILFFFLIPMPWNLVEHIYAALAYACLNPFEPSPMIVVSESTTGRSKKWDSREWWPPSIVA